MGDYAHRGIDEEYARRVARAQEMVGSWASDDGAADEEGERA